MNLIGVLGVSTFRKASLLQFESGMNLQIRKKVVFPYYFISNSGKTGVGCKIACIRACLAGH